MTPQPPRRIMRPVWIIALLSALALAAIGIPTTAREFADPQPAPDFTHSGAETWINSTPLKLAELRGKVVLLDFWTFDCWNCYRSFPWLKGIEQAYGPGGMTVIGIHTPEFEHERVRANVVAKTREFGIEHPVMMDNDYSYWKAMGNRFWPTFYLIDKTGKVRARYIGETHAGDLRARAIEEKIEQLLAEPDPG